jgi:SAM-dependent methyltransferase
MSGQGLSLSRIRRRVLPNLRHLPSSRVRRCGCCRRLTLVVALGAADEYRFCLRCRANLRYELLAEYLRATVEDWSALRVVELDPHSPLRPLLSGAGSYTRSFYDPDGGPADSRDGAEWQDATALTLPDESVDLLVSSDVLEHIPDLPKALAESRRVLKPGGRHVFTVPPRPRTVRRASVRDGEVVHHLEPEVHRDPTADGGILTFWDVGVDDAPEALATTGLELELAVPPTGRDGRVVWCATRIAD